MFQGAAINHGVVFSNRRKGIVHIYGKRRAFIIGIVIGVHQIRTEVELQKLLAVHSQPARDWHAHDCGNAARRDHEGLPANCSDSAEWFPPRDISQKVQSMNIYSHLVLHLRILGTLFRFVDLLGLEGWLKREVREIANWRSQFASSRNSCYRIGSG